MQKISIVLLLLWSATSFAQAEKAEGEIKNIMQELGVAGVSVAVVKHGDIVYTHSFGSKNLETGEPLTDKNIFRIASISKSFSATSIMQLIEAGKASLSDEFGKLIGFDIRNPKYPSTVITLKMVLSHTSSINDSQGYFSLDVINPAKNPDWAKSYNDYEPGKGYQYCNLNFNMVGVVIEKLSGERFDNYVKQHVLDPLKLYGGYCVDSLDSTRFATIYDYDSATGKLVPSPMAYAPRREEIKSYQMGYSTPVFSPTGGMKISATDLAKYMTMHMNRGRYHGVRIIKRRSSKLMQTSVAQQEAYGLAMTKVKNLLPGLTMTGHTGSAYGLFSSMFFNRKKRFGIVVITNGCKPVYEDGWNAVIRRITRSLYQNIIRL